MKFAILGIAAVALVASAQPREKRAIKPIPPAGIEVPASDRRELEAGLGRLRDATAKLANQPLLPDVLIYQEAVRYALQYNEFFKADEIAKARILLAHGEERARQLTAGEAPWTKATGLVVRGYISKIDKSVQPYGLVIPPSYSATVPHRWRLDTWFHGRNETLSEVNFLADREKNPGEFTPRDTIVLHLYGRFCNASKLAGEVDFFEALEDVKRHYPIDENRIIVRGFSMGGASAWHIGAHYAGLWAAVAPGAGFSESAEFLHLKLTGPDAPPEWEQKLFHLYDATDYAVNLSNTLTIAYNGEIDPQKQAADAMERAMGEEGLRLKRVVGPNTPHRYHPDSKVEIEHLLDPIAERGRDPYSYEVRFTTWTLAYNRMKWVVVDALGEHWQRARVHAIIDSDRSVTVETGNVTAFTLDIGPGGCPFSLTRTPVVDIDGQKLTTSTPLSDRSWTVHFRKTQGRWESVPSSKPSGLAKKQGLQGPVDDAFLDSFVIVSPTGTPMAPGVAAWIADEQKHAITEWRRQFRGEAQVRTDTSVTDTDILSSNLVLFGDPGSNKILAKIADRLPVKWTADGVAIGTRKYPSNSHVPVLIYPNPLNPERYVVLNSGFTFREIDYLNNARQTPKLPDYAVVDTTSSTVVHASFFNEAWKLP